MGKTAFRPRISRAKPQSSIKGPIESSFGMAEILNTVQTLKGLVARFQAVLQENSSKFDVWFSQKDAQINNYLATVKKGEPGRDAPSLEVIVAAVVPKIKVPRDGKDANEDRIVERVYSKIKKPKDGKDANEARIVKEIVKKMPTKVEIINEVLKSIKGEKLSIDDIKFLPENLRSIASKVSLSEKGGPGGGGMGNILFFKFTCDGSTTEFILPGVPTQEGAATFAFYQSARLHNDEHFTVSGSTLTTTFTGEDEQIIDGWIIT